MGLRSCTIVFGTRLVSRSPAPPSRYWGCLRETSTRHLWKCHELVISYSRVKEYNAVSALVQVLSV